MTEWREIEYSALRPGMQIRVEHHFPERGPRKAHTRVYEGRVTVANMKWLKVSVPGDPKRHPGHVIPQEPAADERIYRIQERKR